MILYKYLPFDRNSYFENELLRFTQPEDLNDPFECLPQKPKKGEFTDAIRLLTQMISNGNQKFEEFGVQKFNDEFIENLFEQAYQEINNEVGILSLTKNWNNSLMWAHYTNSHKGFCVGFDSNHDFFKDYLSEDKKYSRNTKDVVYSERRVKIPITLTEPELSFEPFLTKSVDWRYEEEVRVISTFNLSEKTIHKIPNSIHLFKVPHSAISEIILGINIDKDIETKIRAFAVKKKITIYKTKISDTEFDMERV
ncbi:DUF2971 domain-containing protein [Flavobacterium sp. FlaQc-52]|jgi:hypothetical protein|uniref:DUF2971 domain-containing protein n=1 Tax=Flavobacterium sp. FlaQc-52 TaxID=3374185 RepID=UPI0037572F0D